MVRDFETTMRQGRLAYWRGVRDAQEGGVRLPVGSVAFVASYRLGVFHVQEGLIRRYELVQVHDGPEIAYAPEDPWMMGRGRDA